MSLQSRPSLPALPYVPVSSLSSLELPVQHIRSDADVVAWRTTSGYATFRLFVARLSEASVGATIPDPSDHTDVDPSIERAIKFLHILDSWIDEIPPQTSAQRFGNLAFRTWGARLDERADELLKGMLESSYHSLIPLIRPYLMDAFGSFGRIDYGSGHETSWALLLLSLALVRFFPLHQSSTLSPSNNPVPPQSIETQIALRVFPAYLRLCFRLQDTYRLEPAGSHGVWGLDDHHFLGFILGAAQLMDQAELTPSAVLRPQNTWSPDAAQKYLYFTQIARIQQLKSGPFHEHSAQIHSIASGVPRWAKVWSGLVKMYEGEVLGKRVVVQHLPLGGLVAWDPHQPNTGICGQPSIGASTTAPWASGAHGRQ